MLTKYSAQKDTRHDISAEQRIGNLWTPAYSQSTTHWLIIRSDTSFRSQWNFLNVQMEERFLSRNELKLASIVHTAEDIHTSETALSRIKVPAQRQIWHLE